MGKAVQKDASRGKLTYPSLLGEEASLLRAQCQIAEACEWIEPFGERGRRLECAGAIRSGKRPLMKNELLSRIDVPADLKKLSDRGAASSSRREMRDALCQVVSTRTAHFASNLGVVELAIALHLVFDFSKDRLIWDTGHQIYPHKLLTGRFAEFSTMRQKGGLMGYPNPAESHYDLFMTGHAGCSVSTRAGAEGRRRSAAARRTAAPSR